MKVRCSPRSAPAPEPPSVSPSPCCSSRSPPAGSTELWFTVTPLGLRTRRRKRQSGGSLVSGLDRRSDRTSRWSAAMIEAQAPPARTLGSTTRCQKPRWKCRPTRSVGTVAAPGSQQKKSCRASLGSSMRTSSPWNSRQKSAPSGTAGPAPSSRQRPATEPSGGRCSSSSSAAVRRGEGSAAGAGGAGPASAARPGVSTSKLKTMKGFLAAGGPLLACAAWGSTLAANATTSPCWSRRSPLFCPTYLLLRSTPLSDRQVR
mmetsp:Transcript_25447/g.73423  ORF Transcript_25447/g.73423 Transcript_25447/m.73423 type:complete len:260 (-) Transcript_25447:169-948(-)